MFEIAACIFISNIDQRIVRNFGSSGVKPGGGEWHIYLPASKIGLLENSFTKEPVKLEFVLLSNCVLLILVISSAYPADKFLIKLTCAPGPGADDYPQTTKAGHAATRTRVAF